MWTSQDLNLEPPDYEFFACLNISLHLNSIASRFRVFSFTFFAISTLFDANIINLCVYSPIPTKISFISLLQNWLKEVGHALYSVCMREEKRVVDKKVSPPF